MRNELELIMLNERAIFIKILPPERVESFLNGNVYCNTAQFFSALDSSDIARSDPDEDVDESWQVKEFAVLDKRTSEYIPVGGLKNPIKFRYKNKQDYNMFCVYMLLENEQFKVNDAITKFGNSAIVIKDIKEFTRRLIAAAKERGLNVYQGPIEYVDANSYHGPMGAFRKFDHYAYQSEFRYHITPGDGTPIELSLGDIGDLCMALNTEDVFTLKSKLSG
ncbi:hypothetical protein ACU6FY_004575 [Vibrio alginolyticus]